MKLLIVGRTSTGKDTLRNILEQDYGLNFVKSYATRPKRSASENTHLFLSKEEAAAIPETDKVARTIIGEYEYFATRKQVEDADAYIVDPKGLDVLTANMPDTIFEILYLTAADKETQKEMAIRRSDDPEKAVLEFEKRTKDEDDQFTDFENRIKNGSFGNEANCKVLINVQNTYDEDCLRNAAFSAYKRIRLHETMTMIAKDMAKLGIVKEKDGKIIVYMKTGEQVNQAERTYEQFASDLLADKEGFAIAMQEYLSLPGSIIDDIRITNWD